MDLGHDSCEFRGSLVVQPPQHKIWRLVLLSNSIPHLGVLEINPYGCALVTMFEPMQYLYQDLALLANKQSIVNGKFRRNEAFSDEIKGTMTEHNKYRIERPGFEQPHSNALTSQTG